MSRLGVDPWPRRALVTLSLAFTLSPLVVAAARRPSGGWNDLFEFLLVCWLIESTTALASVPLIARLKHARGQGTARTLRWELLVARLAFWAALLLTFALPCALAWVWMMAYAMSS